MPDPSRLVTIPSLDDPTTAPDGCSTLYVLEPVPNLNGSINWSDRGPAATGPSPCIPRYTRISK